MAKLKGKEKAAFLRKMARGRNKKRRGHKHSDHHKPRKRRKATKTVAKKRRSSGGFRRRARRVGRRAHKGINKYLPKTDVLVSLATAYAYGKVEKEADKDAKHFLNTVPALVPQLGRAGNAGAIAWVVGKLTRQPTLTAAAAGVLHVAAYQNGRGAGFDKAKQNFTMGAGSRRRDEETVEAYMRAQERAQGF